MTIRRVVANERPNMRAKRITCFYRVVSRCAGICCHCCQHWTNDFNLVFCVCCTKTDSEKEKEREISSKVKMMIIVMIFMVREALTILSKFLAKKIYCFPYHRVCHFRCLICTSFDTLRSLSPSLSLLHSSVIRIMKVGFYRGQRI